MQVANFQNKSYSSIVFFE